MPICRYRIRAKRVDDDENNRRRALQLLGGRLRDDIFDWGDGRRRRLFRIATCDGEQREDEQ